VSFQVTILKALAGHQSGKLELADLRRVVAILISSGRDWTDRTNRLAARAPDLDIFGQSLVIRNATGWRITDEGRQRLASIEQMPDLAPARPLRLFAEDVAAELAPAIAVTFPEAPPLAAAAMRRDRRPERRAARSSPRSAVA
jgi:hypothetical protein